MTLAATVGLAAPWGWFGESNAAAQAAAVPTYGAPNLAQEPNWAEKMVAPLSPGYWRGGPEQRPAPQTANYDNDPIAISSPTGPPTAGLYVAMAEMADRGGNIDESRRLYVRALEMDSKTVGALLGLARLEDRQGRMPEAIAAYRRAASLEPKNTTVLNDLALCLARQGQLGESYQLMRTAINLQPKKPLYRNNMAKILIEMNRHDEAMANLKTVAAPAVANYNMGVLLTQRGRTVEAKRYLAAALTMEPRMEPARVLMAQLTPPTGARPAVAAPQHSIVQTARRPGAFIIPQQAWSPPSTSIEAAPVAPQVDDSILPTPEVQSAAGGAGEAYPTTSMPVASAPAVEMPSASDGPSLLPAVTN